MKHTKTDVTLEFNLPEFERKDIKIKISKNSAAIKAEKKHEKEEEKEGFYHEEKSYRAFNYSTTLPNVDHGKAKTDFKKGVLKIRVPKKK